MSCLRGKAITQIGYVVEALDPAIAGWRKATGIGPWTIFRNVTLEGVHKGEPTRVIIHVGLAYQDGVQIELIEPVNMAPSPYRDAAGRPLCGPHHVAWLTDDLDAAVARAQEDGLEVEFRAESPGTRVAYLAPPEAPEMRYELIESATTAELIRAGIAEAREWDGRDPFRIIDFAAAAE